MNGYKTSTPRVITAAVISAITVAVLALLPAEMRDPTSALSGVVTAAAPAADVRAACVKPPRSGVTRE